MKETNQEKKSNELNFSSTHTDNLPKILKKLNISLIVTSYQTAGVFLLGSDGEKITTSVKRFPRPMGVYADNNRITLGTFSQVLEFKRSDALLIQIQKGSLDNEKRFTKKVLEKEQEKMEELIRVREVEIKEIKESDSLYLPRASITTGMINIHDIAWGDTGLWVVNSTFSCLSTLSPEYSFIAKWKPPFISELVPEDRCHLNGMAMKDGKPKYVTTFNQFNEKDSWTKKNKHDGTLIDIDTNEILLDGLIMPHSPRYYKGFVYICESGTGQVWKYNPITKEKIELIKLQGFTRGVNFYGNLMFVGLSKSRTSNIKNPIPLSKEYEETFSGIWIVNLDDGSEIGHIKFDGDVEQVYDIAIIPNSTNPNIIQSSNTLIRHIFDYKEDM